MSITVSRVARCTNCLLHATAKSIGRFSRVPFPSGCVGGPGRPRQVFLRKEGGHSGSSVSLPPSHYSRSSVKVRPSLGWGVGGGNGRRASGTGDAKCPLAGRPTGPTGPGEDLKPFWCELVSELLTLASRRIPGSCAGLGMGTPRGPGSGGHLQGSAPGHCPGTRVVPGGGLPRCPESTWRSAVPILILENGCFSSVAFFFFFW